MLSHSDIGGYDLVFEDVGAGPPLLLVHGSVSDHRAWLQQLPAFAALYRTIAPSLRHCYPERWDGVGGDFTVAQHALDLAALIRERLSAPVHVVGHSRGGAVAVQLALRYPDLVRGLVLADPGGLEALLPDTAEGRAMAGESEAMFARLQHDLRESGTAGAARAFVDSLGGPGAWDRRSPESQQILLDNISTGPACAERPKLSREALAALRGPILLLTGEQSPRRYGLMLGEMAQVNAGVADVLTIPDAAHAMNRDNPDAFNRAVLEFLQQHCS